MSLFLDTHCHVHFPAYDHDREEVLFRLREMNGGAILIGTSLENGRTAIALAEQHENLWATVGLHPSHVTHPHHDENEGAIHEREVNPTELKALAMSSSKVVAIGEAGLDLSRTEAQEKETTLAKQWSVFETHLDVAEELGLPVVVHCREALRELAQRLSERKTAKHVDRCVLHSFTGTWVEAEALLDLGHVIALNGISTFPPRKGVLEEDQLTRVVERIPLDRLLLETDAPYLAPMPHRGKRNEPAWTLLVAEHIAKVRGIHLEELLSLTTRNAMRVFRLLQTTNAPFSHARGHHE